jgi:hypothetical protein
MKELELLLHHMEDQQRTRRWQYLDKSTIEFEKVLQRWKYQKGNILLCQ